MSAVGRDEFERAVSSYRLEGIAVPHTVADLAESSLSASGLIVAGESHGVEQTPRAVYALARRLGVDALGFEWSWDQFDHVVQPVLETGRVDREALWSLPPEAEAFCGDGRFTAGHVRLLDDVAGGLDELVCVDVLESETPQAREEAMAERILAALRPGRRLLVVVGSWHAGTETDDRVEPACVLLRRAVPGLRTVMLAPAAGTVWFGREKPFEPQPHGLDVELRIGPARPAVVPHM